MIRIGIIGAADIAYRRFLPALSKCSEFTYVGVASHTMEKALRIQESFQGKIYAKYADLLADEAIDAVYLALPPALHFEWGKKVLEAGKHLMMEKPFTIKQEYTEMLLDLAEQKNLAVHENYMFLYHKQLQKVKDLLAEKKYGEIRLIRTNFGFPFRGTQDFRYQKELGGGALLDCGGYPVSLASELLGNARVSAARLYMMPDTEVDLYGSATIDGAESTAQIAFGMDNEYKCDLEIWGSKGCLKSERIFTAPADYPVVLKEVISGKENLIEVGCDDQFYNSIMEFKKLIEEPELRAERVKKIAKQSELVEQIREMGL